MIFLASVPLSLGGIVLGTQIMSFVFGAPYAAGGLAFKILAATLIFDFPASIIINALFAYEHQKSLIVSSALGGVVNVGGDVALIPFFGITGSAIATLIAQAVNNGYLWHAMEKVNPFTVVGKLKKVAAAGIVMGVAATILLLLHVNVIINILACTALYFVVLKLLKEPLLEEITGLVSHSAVVV